MRYAPIAASLSSGINSLDAFFDTFLGQLGCVFLVFLEVSVELGGLPAFYNPHLGTTVRHKVLVMTNNENASLEVLDSFNESINSFHRQVIRTLVDNQHVWPFVCQSSKRHTTFLPSATFGWTGEVRMPTTKHVTFERTLTQREASLVSRHRFLESGICQEMIASVDLLHPRTCSTSFPVQTESDRNYRPNAA